MQARAHPHSPPSKPECLLGVYFEVSRASHPVECRFPGACPSLHSAKKNQAATRPRYRSSAVGEIPVNMPTEVRRGGQRVPIICEDLDDRYTAMHPVLQK